MPALVEVLEQLVRGQLDRLVLTFGRAVVGWMAEV